MVDWMSYEYLWILVSTCILGLWCNLVYQSLLSIQLLLGSLATVCISCPCIAAVSKCANMLPTNTIDLHDHHLDPGMGRSPEVDDQLKQSQLPIMHECGKNLLTSSGWSTWNWWWGGSRPCIGTRNHCVSESVHQIIRSENRSFRSKRRC